MEYTAGDGSDKDDAMKKRFGSAEVGGDKNEKSKDDDEDKKRKLGRSIFSRVENEDDSESKHDDNSSKPEKEEDKPKKLNLESWFSLETEDEDKAEAGESKEDVAIEKLDSNEEHEVVEAYVQSRLEEVGEELESAQPDSPEELEAAANAALLEKIQSEINGESEDAIPDVEAEEILDGMSLREDAEAEGETPELQDDDQELEEDDDHVAVPPGGQPPIVTPPPTPPNPNQTGNTPNQPPTPPVPPVPPGPGGSGGPVGPNAMSPGGPNVINTAPNIVQSPDTNISIERPHHRGRDLLLGGAVGYLLGRRRGRIRTEERLMPVQRELEKQVDGLHQKLADKEAEVRQKARERYDQGARLSEKPTIEKNVEQEQRHEQSHEAQPETSRVETHEDFAAPLAAVELAHAEMPSHPEEHMSLSALLEMAEDIKVDGVDLRTLFEQKRINQKDLQELIGLYLQGKSLESALPRMLHETLESNPEDLRLQQHNEATMSGHSSYMPADTETSFAQNQSVPGSIYNVNSPQHSNAQQQFVKHAKHEQRSYVLLGLAMALVVIAIVIILSALY